MTAAQIENRPNAETASRVYAELLGRQHELIANGQGDSEEAERLADAMDRPWQLLSEGERLSMRQLSAALYQQAKSGISARQLVVQADDADPFAPESNRADALAVILKVKTLAREVGGLAQLKSLIEALM